MPIELLQESNPGRAIIIIVHDTTIRTIYTAVRSYIP